MGNEEIIKMHIVIPLYWIILLVWQLVRPVENRTIIDISFKIIMLASLIVYIIIKTYYNNINTSGLFLLALYIFTQIFSYSTSNDFIDLSYITDLIFTICIVFTFMILNSSIVMNSNDLIVFSKIIVGVVLFLCIYGDIFQFNKIIKAFQTTTGYQNAVSSLLSSNHEFGLYLSFGIVSCLFLVSKSKVNHKNKIVYYTLAALFFINLILTFSRTSLISMVLVIFIWIIARKKYRLIVFGLVVILLLSLLVNTDIRSFFFDIVLRINHDGNRGNLLKGGLSFYRKGSAFEIIFGVGQSRTIQYVRQISISSSFHNGYITILLNGGLSMMMFFLIIVVGSIYNGLLTLKYNKSDGAYLLAGSVILLLFMWGQTPIIFSSDLVSSILTFYCIIVPKYYFNYLRMGMNLESAVRQDDRQG